MTSFLFLFILFFSLPTSFLRVALFMKQQISTYLDHAITFLLLAVVGITPLLFLNLTTEFYEIPKLAFLVPATLLLLGLWIFSWVLKGKIVITRTPLDIPLLILLAVVVISTALTDIKDAAIYGNLPKVHGSAVSWITYILLYFVTVSHLKSFAKIKNFLYVLFGAGVLTAVVTLLSFFHLYLPFDFAKAANFTPTGSSFSTIAFLLLLLPLPLLSIVTKNKYLPERFAVALATLFSITIVLIGSLPTFIALIIAFALSLFFLKPEKVKKKLVLFAIPLAAVVLTLALANLPFPGNKVQQLASSFPREIQLPFVTSWKVSASAFRDSTFFGTGPSTYLFDFTTYKPAEFNLLQFWNFSFDTANNEFLQALGTLGLFGLLALAFIAIVIINNSRKNLMAKHDDSKEETSIVLPALAISGVLTVVLLAIHATTLISIVVTLFILAALMASQESIRSKVTELSLGLKASISNNNKTTDLFPLVLFVVFLIAAVPVITGLFNTVLADYHHRMALTQANKNGTLTYENLQKAERLNPRVDLYRVDMAQTNFALANAIAAKKGPTKDNPKGSLTDKDKQTIQTLLSQSINEGRAAIALNPRSSRNWEVLGSIYRNITGVSQNALAFSLDAYGRAIQRDPLNPALRLNVGGIYYSIKNYDMAIRFFTDAANLKPDYVNAYFNLAIALRDKGDLQNAKLVADQMLTLLEKNKNSEDYKIAVKLVDQLKAKIADKTKEQKDQAAATGQTGSALENPELPNVEVDNLENTPKVTPVPTVRPNPNANLPR